ncbi:unnamed protein product [Ectocarpus sp. 8 AP-2014]
MHTDCKLTVSRTPPPYFSGGVYLKNKAKQHQIQAFLSRNCCIHHHDDHEDDVDSRAGC